MEICAAHHFPFNELPDRARVLRLLTGNFTPADYRAYQRTAHWRSLRAEALERAYGECAFCGRRSGVQVHHKPKGYKRLFREDVERDLLVLCPYHHRTGHGR